ncbi:hypothetical protein H8S20_17565 [Clostridium sp. NSJ-6]|uniref:Uncharacterized protein n=1 Tax=Clostridium hominis TaxID=2763036 RepID=A0ABR7DH00_9CLOT|nr:hypothetical protein [Clostridium hominis]MBC5630666.1 hypothetical protein [Clostridium hominis]MDU2670445.1 hypothetical protein [Clostridium sp.]
MMKGDISIFKEATIHRLESEISEIDKVMKMIELSYEALNKLYCNKESLSEET